MESRGRLVGGCGEEIGDMEASEVLTCPRRRRRSGRRWRRRAKKIEGGRGVFIGVCN